MAAVMPARFYSLMATTLAAFAFVAFSRTYYLRFLSDLPPLQMLVHLHGLVFTAWLVLFLLQARFIGARRVDLHMKLGIAGAVLALSIVILGVMTAFYTAGTPRVRASGLSPTQFVTVPLTGISLFAIFVGLALWFRRKAAFHKRFMLLSMVAVIGPGVGRLLDFIQAGKYSYIVQPTVAAVFVAACLIHDWRRHHVVHPVFAIGGLLLVASWPLRLMAARSDWWQPIGEVIGQWGARLHM